MIRASQVVLVVKNLPANAGHIRSLGREDTPEEGMVDNSELEFLHFELWRVIYFCHFFPPVISPAE